MGCFGGRGGRGGRGGGRGSRNDGPTLPRGLRDELEASGSDRASGFDEFGAGTGREGPGGRGGRAPALDRKRQRKLDKEREKAQRRAWSERKARVKARDLGGGGGGGGRGGNRAGRADPRGREGRDRGRAPDDDGARDERRRGGKRARSEPDPEREPGEARRRRRDDALAEEEASKKKTRSDERVKKPKPKPVALAPKERMSRAALDAYERDEAEQRRLLKKLKGRQKGPDDGLGLFMDGLPGMELLEEKRGVSDDENDDDENADDARALRGNKRRSPVETRDGGDVDASDEEDEGDPFGFGGASEDSEEEDDAEEGAEEEDPEDSEDSEGSEDSKDSEDSEDASERKKRSSSPPGPSAPPSSSGAYVPPARRAAMAAAASSAAKAKAPPSDPSDPSLASARRAVRGLMNRMGESNVAAIAERVCALSTTLPRRAVGDAASAEIVAALRDGPRASERYCCALAAFVAAASGELGPEVGARFGARLLATLEEARAEGNARRASNCVAVFARLHVCGLFPSDPCWGLLGRFARDLAELDATLMLSLLRAAGAKLRSEDPVGMKRFVLDLQRRVADARERECDARASDAPEEDGGAKKEEGDENKNKKSVGGSSLTRRAGLMLDMVVDLKNNKRTAGAGPGGEAAADVDQWGFPNALSRWLRSSAAVGDAAVALRALRFDKLFAAARETTTRDGERGGGGGEEVVMRGQWWLPEAAGTDAWFESRRAQSASERRAASAASRGAESDELLVKARALRMNTEARRAIFCVVMGSEDFADALERLQKLPLADKQDREICRVLIECCLQERAYNPYYETLASKLCERFPKKHKLTLQLCAWDQMREVGFGEAGEEAAGGFGGDPKDKGARVRRIANLARFVAGALLSGAMAPAALKACFGDDADEFASDFSDASASRRRLFRRLLLQALLSAPEGKRLGAARTVFQTVAERASGKGAPREARAIKEAMLRALERGGGAALREGLDAEGGEDEPGSAAYVAKSAREARKLLNGTLA